MSLRSSARAPALLVAFVLAVVGCTGDETGDATTDESAEPDREITVPPERRTPFCEAMIEMTDRLVSDPPADTSAYIIETYEGIIGEVPEEIRPDFEYVLASLRGDPLPDLPEPTVPDTVPTTTITAPPAEAAVTTTTVGSNDEDGSGDPTGTTEEPADRATEGTERVVDEFLVPDATPVERLNSYVEFTCRGTLNNPGPPPTAPDVEIPTDDGF